MNNFVLAVVAMATHPRIVLFLCSGNYFRSRFAEEMFNHWSDRLGLGWQAHSRGLIEDLSGLRNVGSISNHTLNALQLRGVRPRAAERWPQPVSREELAASDLIIAVKEAEHRAMMRARFPDLEDAIHYWAVDDIDVAPPDRCIGQLEQNLLALIRSLKQRT